jgi:nitric oxide reductase subunit B
VLLMATGFATLAYLAARTYRDAPPIPARVVDPLDVTLFSGQDIIAGQQVFLRHGLMENGTIWGHGAYLGPDFSGEYLHTLALEVRRSLSTSMNEDLGAKQKNDAGSLDAAVAHTLKQNVTNPHHVR